MFISIKSKIFIAHLFLIVFLLVSLSYKHYIHALDNYVNNIITSYTNSSSSIITTSSLAISGANYGNIQLPSFVEEVSKHKKLLYFNITGTSDYTSKKFSAVYNKDYKTIYRSKYPGGYEQQLKNKLKRFTSKLDYPSSDKVKLNFLIERTKDKLKHYKQNIEYAKKSNQKSNQKYIKIITKESPYIDFDDNLLLLSLETNNKNGGRVSMIFDISEILNIKSKILNDLFIEASIALFLSIAILMIVANKIIGPLNELSTYLSNNFQSLNPKNTPGIKLKDEIGILSRTFTILLQAVQEKQIETEQKAYYDGLTGVYNRHKFDGIFNEEINRAERYSHQLSIAFIDIDKFKDFNDKYGHLVGDEVLIMIAQNVNSQIRNTDTFARWGGEEFIILFKETAVEEAKAASQKLKDEIQKLQHKTAGSITASFGITQYIKGDTIESIFKRCDDALYIAKENGRNRVEVL